MLNKRIGEIFTILEKENSVSVEELAQRFNVSLGTIRRDLQIMEDNNMIKRYYGGAVINTKEKNEKSVKTRDLMAVKEKQLIARYAASLIRDGDIVYLDAGSTTSKIIQYITAKDITVVTQGIHNITLLIQRGITCYSAGGFLKNNNEILVGDETVEKIRSMKFNITFLGANGVHPVTGFTTTDESEAKIKTAALKAGEKCYIMADSSKFGVLNFFRFANIDDASVITDNLIEGFDYSIFKELISVTGKEIRRYREGKPQ